MGAYETGRREPALSTLQRLVEATGHEFVVEARPAVVSRRALPNTPLARRLPRHRRAVFERLVRSGASTPMVFGSVARGDDHTGSDIDLLVAIPPDVGLVGLVGLTEELTELLGVEVDVEVDSAIRADVRERIIRETIPL